MRADKYIGEDLRNIRKDRWKEFFIYTLLFALIATATFCVLILSHKTFLRNGDGWKQQYFWVVEYQNLIESVRAGEPLSIWTWYRGSGMNLGIGYFLDPMNLLAALFPKYYIELAMTAGCIIKMYLAGFAFMLFGREVRMDSLRNIIGALCYAFAGWFIEVSLCQTQFLIHTVVFPLLILGIERIYNGKRPTCFILAVAYSLILSAIFSYMSGIIVIVYIALRYFAHCEKASFGGWFRNFFKFIGYGIVGVMISAFSMMSIVIALTGVSTDSGISDTSMNALYGLSHLMESFVRVVGIGMVTGYDDMGIPILILILFPVVLRNLSRRSTHLLMCVVLTAVYVSPALSTFMNGMTFPSERWLYAFIFFCVWCGIEQLDIEVLSKRGSLFLMIAGYLIVAVMTAGLAYKKVIEVSEAGLKFICIQLAAGALLLIVLAVVRRKQSIGFASSLLIIVLTFGAVSAGWTYSFHVKEDNFLKCGTGYNRVMSSAQRVANQIEDDGFYRIDAKTGAEHHTGWYNPCNENVWWKINTVYVYNSRIPVGIFKFNKLLGNNYGYSKRVSVLSNGNRIGLDYLYGVRYFLGTDHKELSAEEENKAMLPSNYAGYGYEYSGQIDEVDVFRNKYDVGLGFVYDKVLPESELMKLARNEREQVIMQAAVVPDGKLGLIPADRIISAEQVDIDVTDVPFTVVTQDGASLEGNKVTVTEEEGSITIHVDDIVNSQLIVSFDNLRKVSGGASYQMWCKNDRVSKTAVDIRNGQSLPVENCDFNMGYFESYSGDFNIRFSKPGEYTFDRFYVTAMDVDNYDRYASVNEKNRFVVTEYDTVHVAGEIDSARGGVLFLSIPENRFWDVYVDGVKAQKVPNTDIAFLGALVTAGRHDVVLKYNNYAFKAGIIISALGIIILIAVNIAYSRRK